MAKYRIEVSFKSYEKEMKQYLEEFVNILKNNEDVAKVELMEVEK